MSLLHFSFFELSGVFSGPSGHHLREPNFDEFDILWRAGGYLAAVLVINDETIRFQNVVCIVRACLLQCFGSVGFMDDFLCIFDRKFGDLDLIGEISFPAGAVFQLPNRGGRKRHKCFIGQRDLHFIEELYAHRIIRFSDGTSAGQIRVECIARWLAS